MPLGNAIVSSLLSSCPPPSTPGGKRGRRPGKENPRGVGVCLGEGLFPLNNELFAWKLETKRITATIESGLILSQSSLKLFESISEANKAYTSSTYITGPEKSEFENIKSALSKSMFDLDKYQKLSKRHHPLFSPIEYLDTKLDFTTNEMLILNTSSVIHTLIDIAFGYTKIVESSHPFNEILSGPASDSNLAHIDLSVSLTKISEDSNILNLKTQGLIESIKELDLYKESETLLISWYFFTHFLFHCWHNKFWI